jgi:hypothetical protein
MSKVHAVEEISNTFDNYKDTCARGKDTNYALYQMKKMLIHNFREWQPNIFQKDIDIQTTNMNTLIDNDPRIADAINIFDSVNPVVLNEHEGYVRNFLELFYKQYILNSGVTDESFVSECVRRCFCISQVVPFNQGKDEKGDTQLKPWVTEKQIEDISRQLIGCGFIVERDERT